MSMKAEAIFHAARALSREEHEEYLRRACGSDEALRAEIDELLQADAEAGPFMDPNAGGPTGSGSQPSELIGRYKLLQRLGEGGFGEVWMAEQSEPVRRRVALKVMKLGMDTRRLIARFEAERQALALMDHPHIARVLDAGATAQGRPYFVMELVRGVAITEYCDRENLAIEARLELFRDVCLAVQHAHQKGIIHRDLKPSNVLVTVADGRATPKVIDFGIAKATQGALTDKTLFTELRQLIGTPAYMSPEQAEMSGVDIDTRTDVYSLGVLLYELLTGTTPLSTQELLAAGLAEIHRIIREVEPTKPSTKLSTSEALPSIAAHRHTEPKRLGALVRGDLDWIVMRCLEKDRGRRYATASALAEDVRRHLAGEAVEAAPPSRAYRARKFVRRHRTGVSAALLVGLVLVLGIAGTTFGLLRATDQAARAERELDRAREVKRFLSDMLGSVDPDVAQGQDSTLLRGMLDDAAVRIAAGTVEDIGIEADLRDTIGSTYLALGRHDLAAPHLLRALEIRREVLGEDDPATLDSLGNAGQLLLAQGRFTEAEATQREAVDRSRRALGDLHPTTLRALNDLAVALLRLERLHEAENVLVESLAGRRRQLGARHSATLLSMNNLAAVWRGQGRWAESESLMREILDIQREVSGEDHPNTITTLHNLGRILLDEGRYEESESCLRDALDRSRRVLGPQHAATLTCSTTLGRLLTVQNRLGEAEPLVRESLELARRVLGNDHPSTLNAMSILGGVLVARRGFSEAERLLRESLEGHLRVIGAGHPDTLGVLNNLAALYADLGRLDEAEAAYREMLAIARRVMAPDDPRVLTLLRNLGSNLRKQGRPAEAEPFSREALDVRRRRLGSHSPDTLSSVNEMALVLHALGRLDEAEPLYREALEARRIVLGDEHPRTLESMANMGFLLHGRGDYAAAERWARDAYERQRVVLGDAHPDTLNSMSNLAYTVGEQGRSAEAERLFLAMLDGMDRAFAPDHPRRLAALDSVATLFEKQGRWGEAEPLLCERLDALRRVHEVEQPQLVALVTRLGQAIARQERLAVAEPYYREAYEGWRRLRGEESRDALVALNNLGWLLNGLERFDEAVDLLVAGEAAARGAWAGDRGSLGNYLTKLGRARVGLGELQAADATLREAHALLAADYGAAHEATIANVRAMVLLHEAWEARQPGAGHAAEAETWRARLDAPERAGR
jgi:tetratricopeptide (TPR) repeat protein